MGPYRLLEELGRGGMGVVYRAQDPGLEREVALKLLPLAGASPVDLARLRLEARAAAALRHPGIVRILGTGVARGQAWVAMELVPGEPLSALMQPGPLPPARAVRLGLELARALEHAHARGVVHRDLKPDNVIVTGQGQPVLIDFGLAKLLGRRSLSLSVTGEVLGTPSYMAPEQVRGDGAIGPASDVYALGATLYHALTGAPPLRGTTLLETLQRVLTAEPDLAPIRARAPGLEGVLARCLAKEPGQRYPSGGALAAALEGWLTAPRRGARARRALRGALLVLLPALTLFGWRTSAALAPEPSPSAQAQATVRSAPSSSRGAAAEQLSAARERALAGDPIGAEGAFQAAIELDPGWAAPRLARGRWRSLREHAGALPDLRRACELAAGDLDAWDALARACARAGDLDGVQAARRRADALPGGRALGELRSPPQDPVHARTRADEVVALAPASLAARRARAEVRLRAGDLDGAQEDLARILELDPASDEAIALRARLCGARGAWQEAREDAERLLRLAPDDLIAWSTWSEAAAALHQDPAGATLDAACDPQRVAGLLTALGSPGPKGEQRLALAERVLSRAPRNQAGRFARAQAIALLGRLLEARRELVALGRLAPGAAGLQMELARVNLELGRLNEAQRAAELALPDVAPVGRQTVHLLLAEVLSRGGHADAAVEHLVRAGECAPLSAEQQYGRGELRLCLGQAAAAVADLEQAQAQLPAGPGADSCAWLLALARRVAARGEDLRSLQALALWLPASLAQVGLGVLDRALALAPDDPESLSLRGQLCSWLGAGGRDDLDRAVQLAPEVATVLGRRALVRSLQDGGAELDEANRALALDPGQAEALLALVQDRLTRGDAPGALALLDRVPLEASGPTRSLTSRMRGLALALAERRPEAWAALQAALQDSPRDPQLLTHAASVRSRTSLEVAADLVARALLVAPNDVNALMMAGAIRSERGDLRGAREELDRAVALAPDGRAYPARAEVRRRQGDRTGALSDLECALRREPDAPRLLVQRGLLLEEMGDLEAARADLARARGRDPVGAAALEEELRGGR